MAEQKITPELELDEAIATAQQKATLARLKGLARKPGDSEPGPEVKTHTELRIDEILLLMRHGEWIRGESDRVFAELWGVAETTIRGLAAEANRVLRRELVEKHEDADELKTDLRESFLRIARKAEKLGTPNALRAAADALDKAGAYLGIKPAAQVQHIHDEFEDYTDEELQAFLHDGTRPKRAK